MYVPTVACRLFDSRPAPDTVGPRSTPLGADDTMTVQVTGANGNCAVPVEATAVAVNVIPVGPTARTAITLYPAGTRRPAAANLTIGAGGTPSPNLAIVAVSTDGAIDIHNVAGTVDVLGDVVGYFEAAVSAEPGPARTSGTDRTADRPDRRDQQDSPGSAPAWLGFSNTAVDTFRDAGRYSSIVIGIDGLPVIAYEGVVDGELRIVHCADAACSTSDSPRIIDSATDAGSSSSITIGADGMPIVAYGDSTNRLLKIVHCTDVACTTNDAPRVITTDAVVWHTSITIGADGNPILVYTDVIGTYGVDHFLNVVHCTDIACTASHPPRGIDTFASPGDQPSLTIGADGFAIVSYFGMGGGDLTIAHCTNVACTTSDPPRELDTTDIVGTGSSITIAASGNPVIAYEDTSNAHREGRALHDLGLHDQRRAHHARHERRRDRIVDHGRRRQQPDHQLLRHRRWRLERAPLRRPSLHVQQPTPGVRPHQWRIRRDHLDHDRRRRQPHRQLSRRP